MEYDYVIIGGGPSGLSLSYILSKNNYNICLIEKYHKLGGSWNSEWINNKYFTENAPRVLSKKGPHMDFLHEIGMHNNDFEEIYGTIFDTNKKIFYFIKKFFKPLDYFIFVKELLFYKIRPKNMLLQDWMNESSISENAKKCLRIISITVCDTPKNTNHHDFFGSIGAVGLVQMKEPNKWIDLLEEYFNSINNIKIYKNTTVNSIDSNNNRVNKVTCIKNDITININANNIILCTQSDGIYNILKNSNYKVQNNWHSLSRMKQWSENTHYNGIGFQLHFKEKFKFPDEWCWSCITDWNIIILPVSNWLLNFTKDENIKTVWSCCIVDMETKSSRINKSPNQCNKKELIDEIIFQLKNNYKTMPCPHVVTFSPNLTYIDGKWSSNNTGFTRKNFNYLDIRGKLDGLYALGCFTDPGYDTIAYMSTAIQSVKIYLNKYHKNLLGFQNNIELFNIKWFIIIIIIIIVICKYKKKWI